MKKLKNVTAGMILAPVVTFTLAHGQVPAHTNEYLLPHDHVEERPSSAPEKLWGSQAVIFHTSTGTLSSSPFPRSWPPLPFQTAYLSS